MLNKHNIDNDTYKLVKAWYDASTRHTRLSCAHGIVISATILPIITHPDFRVWINGVVVYKSGGRSYVSSEQLANFIKSKNIELLVKQAEQNSFSAGDLSKFIDLLKTENINIKLIYEDYIDVKSPTLVNYSQFNDYDVHGIIVQEQQNLARRYKIPLITSTQLKRGSEALNLI